MCIMGRITRSKMFTCRKLKLWEFIFSTCRFWNDKDFYLSKIELIKFLVKFILVHEELVNFENLFVGTAIDVCLTLNVLFSLILSVKISKIKQKCLFLWWKFGTLSFIFDLFLSCLSWFWKLFLNRINNSASNDGKNMQKNTKRNRTKQKDEKKIDILFIYSWMYIFAIKYIRLLHF